MEKGIYIILNKETNTIYVWENDKFFSEEEIQGYMKTGKRKEKNELLLPIFNQDWMALQYIKANKIKDVGVARVLNQTGWSKYIDALKRNGVQRAVLNRCILNVAHECCLMLYDMDEISDFEKTEAMLKKIDLACGGYDKRKLLDLIKKEDKN